MKSLGILFYKSPIQNSSPATAYEIAKAALKKGYKVKIFCFMDGVYSILKGHGEPPKGMLNIEEAFNELIKEGAQVIICDLTARQRGVKNVLDGVIKGGTPDLAHVLSEIDKFIVIR